MSKFQDLWKKTAGRVAAVDTDGYEETDPMAKEAHTAKWDRCVEHVKSSSPGADPFAVCTAMLGDESLKAMDEARFNGLIDKALEEMAKDNFGVGSFGISGAGPIPRSLLAGQDLESSSTKKSASGGFTSHTDLVERMRRNQKVPVGKARSFRDAWAAVKSR